MNKSLNSWLVLRVISFKQKRQEPICKIMINKNKRSLFRRKLVSQLCKTGWYSVLKLDFIKNFISQKKIFLSELK